MPVNWSWTAVFAACGSCYIYYHGGFDDIGFEQMTFFMCTIAGIFCAKMFVKRQTGGGTAIDKVNAAASFSKPENPPPPYPEQLNLSPSELAAFNATDNDKPVFLAINGTIFDVSDKRSQYIPGKPYHCFVGRDCARALALMSLTPENCSPDMTGLTDENLVVLHNWMKYYGDRYPRAGRVVYTHEEETQFGIADALIRMDTAVANAGDKKNE